MFHIFKQLFRKISPNSQEYGISLPRNRFENLDFERVLKCESRRFFNEGGLYDESAKIMELEFSEGFGEFEFLIYFKTGEEKQFEQLIASLNDFDNAIQSSLEREFQNSIPQNKKKLNNSRERREKYFYFHPWILSCEEAPPSLRYVADNVNYEFTVYFSKNQGRWQAYWDLDCQKLIQE